MSNLLRLATAGVTGLILGIATHGQPAQAALFEQQEVDQSKFIAIAVPISQGKYYNLLILEQQATTRPCWSESGTDFVTVDPLLLSFDFTKICGRSTDSNGYSIRIAGQDMALTHKLTLEKRGNELVLMGMPQKGGSAGAMEIGSTRGLSSEFMKIQLQPGWRFTKRVYNGKPLGHIYLTRDTLAPGSTDLPAVATTQPRTVAQSVELPVKPAVSTPKSLAKPPAKPGVTSPATTPLPTTANPSTPKSQPIAVEIPVASPPSTRSTAKPAFFPNRSTASAAKPPGAIDLPAPPSATPAAKPIEIPVSPPPATTTAPVTANPNSQPIAVSSPATSRSSSRLPVLQSGIPLPVSAPPTNTAEAPIVISQRVGSPSVLPVPGSSIPMGNASGEPDVISGDSPMGKNPPPPPAQSALVGPRYRVVVETSNTSQQSQVRQLVPDAFRSTYQGRSVMQVGSFEERTKADPVIQKMQSNGYNPIIEVVQ